MELKEFITETIVQITDGLRDGHNYVVQNGYGSGISDSHYRDVTFDIALSTVEEESTGKKGNISVANILNAGAQEALKSNSSNISRIQFKIELHIKSESK